MNLDEAHKKKVAAWVAEGLKLSDIQKRLMSELGVTLTYMEVRFLVDDLKLTPKDIEPPKTADLGKSAPGGSADTAAPDPGLADDGLPPEAARVPGGVSLSVDEISRPGTVASGKVTFSDGNTAEWYLDQMGRLGLLPKTQGYRPSQLDVAAFQTELQRELGRLGF